MTNELLALYNGIFYNLWNSSPILSGNMKKGIKVKSVKDNEIVIEIEAKFYNTSEWKKTGKIIYTNKGWKKNPQITNYAMWVNDLGAFGRANKSKFWVNRSLDKSVSAVASQLGAIYENKLQTK